ncbi:MAG: FlgD immunoglobulin-like domain containing protein [Bacteroidota bacterium]
MKTILLLVCGVIFAQSQNKIPFASQNNAIELSIANASTVAANIVVVEVTSAPEWLPFPNRKVTIENLSANQNKTAHFTFSVDKSASVNKSEQIIFTISNSNGERWTKTLSLQVSPPEKFELFQNYPNPFNPTTVISYQIPVASHITLKIFDAIGREVATLDEGMKEAGYHEVKWNAMNASSGMYIYQLAWKDEKGEQKYYRKKLLVMK